PGLLPVNAKEERGSQRLSPDKSIVGECESVRDEMMRPTRPTPGSGRPNQRFQRGDPGLMCVMSKKLNKQLHRNIILSAIAMLVALVPGCPSDPVGRRQRLLESGQRYFDKSEYSAASIEFRKAIQVDPKSAEAHYRLGLTYWRLQNWQESYRSL